MTTSTEATATTSVEEANKALVAEFMASLAGGDVDKVLSYMADSLVWWVAGTVEGISGTKDKEAFGELVRGIAGATTNGVIRLTPLAWTAEGDRVAVEAESLAELANGRVYNNFYHLLFEVRDAKIQVFKEYCDTEHARAILVAP